MSTDYYLAENHGLTNGHDTVDVGDGDELGLGGGAVNPVLANVIDRLFFASEPDDDGVSNDVFGKGHDGKVISGAEQHHLAGGRQVLVDADGLVLVALSGDHHVGLVQHEHRNLLQVKESILDGPVKNLQTPSKTVIYTRKKLPSPFWTYRSLLLPMRS